MSSLRFWMAVYSLGTASCLVAPGAKIDDALEPVVRRDGGGESLSMDAGVDSPVRLRDIELVVNVRDYRKFAGLDGGELPLSFPRSDDVRAQWRQRDGGWGLANAAFLDDGGYLIQGVPEGEAIIFVRSSTVAAVTRANFLDMSLVVAGRNDAVVAPSNV